MNSYNNIIGDCIILHEYTNTRIHEYVYSYNDIIGDRIILLHEYTNTWIQEYTNTRIDMNRRIDMNTRE